MYLYFPWSLRKKIWFPGNGVFKTWLKKMLKGQIVKNDFLGADIGGKF